MQSIIRVEHLVKHYKRAQVNAVDDVSFDVAPGEFFVLLGPNGAGKTTTISILTTTLAPTSGKVLIAGHDVALEASAVRQSVTTRVPNMYCWMASGFTSASQTLALGALIVTEALAIRSLSIYHSSL